MKIVRLTSIALCMLYCNVSYAKNTPYIGVDILHANANHQLDVNSDDVTVCGSVCKAYFDGKETRKNSVRYAINAGYTFNFNKLFVAPEVFFDQLQNSSDGFHDSGYSNDYKAYKIDLNYRYGLKAHLGYHITPRFNAFATWGFANLDYDERPTGFEISGVSRKASATELDQLFGFGFAYKIGDHMQAKLTYDRQSMRLRSTNHGYEGSTIKTTLDVVKLGLAYHF